MHRQTDRGKNPKLCWEYNKLQLYGEVNARFIKIKHPTQFWLYCLLFVLMTTTLQWRRARSGSHGIAIYPLIKTNQTKQIAYYNTNHRKLKKDNLIWFIILLLLPIQSEAKQWAYESLCSPTEFDSR